MRRWMTVATLAFAARAEHAAAELTIERFFISIEDGVELSHARP